MMRRCTKCRRELPATPEHFPRAQQGRLRGDCKACNKVAHAAQYQRNKVHRDAINRRWVQAHPEARRQSTKTYRERHGEKCRTAVARWFARDPEHARALNRAKTKRWYQRHLERARAGRRAVVKRRRALKRGAGESKLTHAEWVAIQALYDHRCAYCDRKGRLTQDHVVPLVRGGPHTAANVVPACMTCNCSKKAGRPSVPVETLKFLS